VQNKNQNFNGAARNNTSNVRHHMNSLSAVRQVSFAVFLSWSVVYHYDPFFIFFCLDFFL